MICEDSPAFGKPGIGRSVVEFSPAMRESRVRFPANAMQCRLGNTWVSVPVSWNQCLVVSVSASSLVCPGHSSPSRQPGGTHSRAWHPGGGPWTRTRATGMLQAHSELQFGLCCSGACHGAPRGPQSIFSEFLVPGRPRARALPPSCVILCTSNVRLLLARMY